MLQATQSVTGPDIRYRFNHGDGTLDPNPVSQAYYAQPGTYPISLEWFFQGTIGNVACGTVKVAAAQAAVNSNPQVVTLSEFLGLGRDQAVAQAANRGFAIIRLTREDSVRYVISNDFRQDRLNLELDNGRVSRASVG